MPEQPAASVLPFPRASEAIELRHLRSFVAVAEELNYTRAAARLHVSRPALSRQISTLEGLVGVPLLLRSTHRVELTIAGEALLDRARAVLGDVDAAVKMTQSVGGELIGRMTRLWNPVAEQFNADADIDASRAAFEAMHAKFGPPDGIGTRPVSAGGVPSLVLAPDGDPPITMLYLHGGGHVLGSAFGYRHLAGALADAAAAGVLLPDYRLAPEHPYPADVEDAMAAYRWLLGRGMDPSQITVVGDSSGALLALTLLLRLRADDVPMPAGAALLCPSGDLSWTHPYPSGDLAAAMERMGVWNALYLDGHPADDPMLNPSTTDLSGLPPILLQACTGDMLLDQARRLTERAVASGVEARLELYPTPMHSFHVFWSFLPEAADALERVAQFSGRD